MPASSPLRRASLMQAFRRSRLWPFVALLALAVQLLLPMRHATAMAQASGDPLMMAFCGSASAPALQRLRETAPPDLLAALHLKAAQEQAQSSEDAPCSFCNGLSGLHTPALAHTAWTADIRVAAAIVPLSADVPVPLTQLSLPPLARGPPLSR